MSDLRYIRPRTPGGTITLAEATTVADSIRGGGIAILPTETGYMMASLATSPEALVAVFAAKKRAHTDVMHVACSSLRMVDSVGILTPVAARLLGRFTPGPLTVIVRKTGLLPDTMVTLEGTVGIRIPDHPATLQIIAEVGSPVTASSLNEAGGAPVAPTPESLAQLNLPKVGPVFIVEDSAATTYSAPSTLVRVTGSGTEILRRGPIGEPEILQAADSIGPIEVADWT